MNSTTWHRGIGSGITPDMTIDEQLKVAGLNWKVETSDIVYGNYLSEQTNERKAIYRSDSGQLLDVAGKNWQPFQNKDLLQTFHSFASAVDLKIDHLGSLDNGRVIFAGANLDIELDIAKVGDIVRGRILLFNFHKVGYGLQVRLQFERLICTNGMTQPVKVGSRSLTHVSSLNPSKIERILQSAFENAKQFEHESELLAQTPMSIEQATLLLINEFGNPKLPVDQQPTIVDTCLRLFKGNAKGSDMLSAYNTAWGLLNSVTEYFNHHSQIRGGSSTHLNSLLLGSKANKQNQFYQQLVSVSSR